MEKHRHNCNRKTNRLDEESLDMKNDKEAIMHWAIIKAGNMNFFFILCLPFDTYTFSLNPTSFKVDTLITQNKLSRI